MSPILIVLLNIIVESLILNQDPIGNLKSIGFFILLVFNFDQVGTNSVMTHVLVLSVKVRSSDRLK